MTHPEALVEKLAKTIYDANPETDGTWENNPIPFDWRSSRLASERARLVARAVLDLFEVREEHVNPNQYLYGGLDVPQNGRRFVLTTAWEPTDA